MVRYSEGSGKRAGLGKRPVRVKRAGFGKRPVRVGGGGGNSVRVGVVGGNSVRVGGGVDSFRHFGNPFV